ncbi:MAG TPA: sugar phosphate isomerase/epimerase family protein [Candidatus Acidoferrales bacterium]|nr:sugar phosphate isomerase/epimerase family protein [Candidatus Acidoferrales bacterium]
MPRYPIAAITDEFSPDLETAVRSMRQIGMTGAELRMVSGRNIIDLTDSELDRAIGIVRGAGMEIISIASPVLKCVLPGAPDIDPRFQQDMFASQHTFADQPRLAERAFEIARRTGARIVRVFSYWRTVQPDACFDRIVAALRKLADQAAAHNLIIGIENEHACNIGTGSEAARLLAALDHPNLKLVWDPANCVVGGEKPVPDGYRKLPVSRIQHVHAKDCTMDGHKPDWCRLGEGLVGWREQIELLVSGGYRGWISLETHWPGPGGNKHEASMICGRALAELVA